MSYHRGITATNETVQKTLEKDISRLGNNIPKIFEKKVNLNKINIEVMKGWVIDKVSNSSSNSSRRIFFFFFIFSN